MGFEIERMFTDDELQCIEEYKKETNFNLANYTTKDLFVLENPRLQGLKELCQQAVNNYFIQIFDPINPDKVNLVLTQSWLNYTSKGHHHHQHHHHNSVLSGCLYIKADRNIDKIKFIKEREEFFKGLSKFLSGLYQETAAIQQKILDNLGKLNSVMGEMSTSRVNETLKMLSDGEDS